MRSILWNDTNKWTLAHILLKWHPFCNSYINNKHIYSTFYYPYGIGYGVGVARSKDLLGPYDKFHKLILHTDFDTYANGENTTFISPGHCSVVEVRYSYSQEGRNS